MAKKKFDLFSRLEHAERKLESAKSPKEVDALKERIKNIMKMLKDDYDYGKFKTGVKFIQRINQEK